MSFGVSQDNWAFGSASWIWDLVFEEITVEELQEATDESLLEIVADAVDNVVADLLPGNADELIAFAEEMAQREPQLTEGMPAAEAGESLSTGDVLSGLATLMALADVLQGVTGQEDAATSTPNGVTPPMAETLHAPPPPAAPPPAPRPAPPVLAAHASPPPLMPAAPAKPATPATRHATIKLQSKWRLAPSCWWQLVAKDNPERTLSSEGEQQRKQLQQALDAEWLHQHPRADALR